MKNRLDKLKKVKLILIKILDANKELLEHCCVEGNKEFRESLLAISTSYHKINEEFIYYLMIKLNEFTEKDIIDLEFSKIVKEFENEKN